MHPASEGMGLWLRDQQIEKQREKEQRKNKIYFIWKLGKDFYLCTPNRKEGKKRSGGGCHYDYKNKIETDEKQAKTNTT